ncbi:tyrosine-protein phosphatase [Paenibacillus sp.]|uniref:tyrosine-protein phosphatase n=1 Tax=Paenibacillus sp. TaxID=58172 RepID=UPI002D264077|nr:CpsB/CapC family capsule biosynthesis tyrosine phosphatase [Paenibacillus sp.]HZG84918.1 CpsB/CapC family capsule biosynthesis tyrosine phosphatase [Paenibacillus sp.]
MIDIHCHILPCLDDGAQTLEDATAMARQAVRHGIATVVATPHYMDGIHWNEGPIVHRSVKQLKDILAAEEIPLQVLPGQEIRVFGSLMEELQEGKAIPITQSPYLLLELPSEQIPDKLDDLIYELQLRGMTAVIAHPERNRAFLRQPDRLLELVERGALCQLTARSILGSAGKGIETFSWQLCERNLIHFIASDAHDCGRRGFRLLEAYDAIRKRLGNEYCEYYITNAEHLVEGRVIDSLEPIRPARRFFSSLLFGRK